MKLVKIFVLIVLFTSCNSLKTSSDLVGKYKGKWGKWNLYSLELKSDSSYYFKEYTKPFFPYSDGKWSFKNGNIYLTSKMDSMLIEDEKMRKIGLAVSRHDFYYFDFQNEKIELRKNKLILTPDTTVGLKSDRIVLRKIKK